MWFSVNLFLKAECASRPDREALWEEMIVIVQAESDEAAREQVHQMRPQWECEYQSASGDHIVWRVKRIQEPSLLGEELSSGSEVFTRFLRTSEVESLLKPFE